MGQGGDNTEHQRDRKSDDRIMKFDRRMNMTALQSLSTQTPQASVRLVILCPSEPYYNVDQLETCQFRTEVAQNTPTVGIVFAWRYGEKTSVRMS